MKDILLEKNTMPPAIELKELTKTYTQKNGQPFKAVDNLSLTIPQGQVIGFLGPNGAGKTTTIKMICNLITPSHGSISLNGYSLAKDKYQAVRQIGAVLEGTRNVYWQLSAWQNLLYFGRLKGIYGKALHDQATKLLTALELMHKKDEAVGNFSRGTQQKVAIACALIANPPIVLLDEPTLGLDVKAARTIKQWIAHLAQEEHKTIVLTTHQLDIAEQVCERIVIMSKGKLIADSPTQELLKVVHEEHYQITVAGKVTNPIVLPGMQIIEKEDHTIFSGAILDQQELYEKLSILRNLELSLVSVTRTKNNLEDVFMQLTKKDNAA
jgi:ABC-2 type transport system ATP-binding protein